MQYKNLGELILHSSSTRQYFLSLPTRLQMELHEQDDYIHSAAQLRSRARAVEEHWRQLQLGGWQ